MSDTPSSALPRQVADAYVDAFIELDPITGTYLGVAESSRRLPDFSPAGQEAVAALIRHTLVELDAAERLPGADDPFAGIAPSSTLGFIAAQLVGGGVGYLLVRYFYPRVTV